MATCAALGAPDESSGSVTGVTLLPSETVETCLIDRRRAEMVQPFRLALLKLSSQDAARLMAAGDYEASLPIALDAVKQGQDLFKPSPAVQLFPLYLLAAQANLGLKRAKPCEDFLGLASWLALKEPDSCTNVMRSQLSRLFGQLRAMQGEHLEVGGFHLRRWRVCACALRRTRAFEPWESLGGDVLSFRHRRTGASLTRSLAPFLLFFFFPLSYPFPTL